MVTLTTLNFNYSNVTSPNGDDIRFDIEGTLCDYWIEKWNPICESKIWVEIPIISANQTVILNIYYSNSAAIPAINGDNTFILFDDFNDNILDSAKWQDISSGAAFIEESGQKIRCVCDTGLQKRGMMRSTNEIIESNIVLHLKMQLTSVALSSGLAMIHYDGNHSGTWDYPENAFMVDWAWNSNIYLDKQVPGITAILDQTTQTRDLNWHDIEIRYYIQNLEVFFDDINIHTAADSQNFTTEYIGFAGRESSGTDTNFDDIFVTKYISPVPTIVFSTEQINQ